MCVEFCDCDSLGSDRRVGKKNMLSAAKEKKTIAEMSIYARDKHFCSQKCAEEVIGAETYVRLYFRYSCTLQEQNTAYVFQNHQVLKNVCCISNTTVIPLQCSAILSLSVPLLLFDIIQ